MVTQEIVAQAKWTIRKAGLYPKKRMRQRRWNWKGTFNYVPLSGERNN